MFLAAILCCSGVSHVMPLDHVIFDQCMISPARVAQVEAMDRRNVHDLLRRFGAARLPQTYRRSLARLVHASPGLAGQKVSLVAYTSKFLNAHEADHGVIVISAAAWSKDKDLAEDEVAAVLAHEVAHLELKDSQRTACEALAYVSNAELTLPSAIRGNGAGSIFRRYPLVLDARHLESGARKRSRCQRRPAPGRCRLRPPCDGPDAAQAGAARRLFERVASGHRCQDPERPEIARDE